MLERILADKEKEVAAARAAVPLAELKARLADAPPPRDFTRSLRRGSGRLKLIAEVKRRSPSRGWLNRELDAAGLAAAYERAGAAAVSVLTDGPYFGGAPADLAAARAASRLPVLRKEFLIDPYQVYESRALGADAVLLIVAALGRRVGEFLALARELALAALVEVHDEEELGLALAAGAEIIGINNRDLRTMRTDLAVTRRLRPLIPPGRVVVSESGIHGPEQMGEVAALGVDAALVGEALVTGTDPGARARVMLSYPGAGAVGLW